MSSIHLLGVKRLVQLLNPERKVPQTSVISVNIDREKIERIRKNKGIYIRTFEEKINLSKSRYYRWLNYEVDLPIEYILSITKLLGISQIEFKDLFISSTDELLEILILAIDLSLRQDDEEERIFTAVLKELEKFRFSKQDTLLYQLILFYCEMVQKIQTGEDASHEIERIESYLSKNEYFTLYDLILYLGVLRFKQLHQVEKSYVEMNLDNFSRLFLSKIKADRLVEVRSFLLGSIIDLALALEEEFDTYKAFIFLVNANRKIQANWHILAYDQQIIDIFLLLNSITDETVLEKLTLFLEQLTETEDYLHTEEIQFITDCIMRSMK